MTWQEAGGTGLIQPGKEKALEEPNGNLPMCEGHVQHFLMSLRKQSHDLHRGPQQENVRQQAQAEIRGSGWI